VRTWDENRTTINQLWPQCQWTDEERRLWKDDLCGLDQDVLYGALRNVKRSRDTLYPQLKWILDECRDLSWSRKRAARQTTTPEPKLDLSGISDEEDKRLSQDFVALIDMSEPSRFEDIKERVLDKLPQMHARSAIRVLTYARERLLGEAVRFGKVLSSGDVKPITIGDSAA
jgi:hypothetical protein